MTRDLPTKEDLFAENSPFPLTDLDKWILAQKDEEFKKHDWEGLRKIIGEHSVFSPQCFMAHDNSIILISFSLLFLEQTPTTWLPSSAPPQTCAATWSGPETSRPSTGP